MLAVDACWSSASFRSCTRRLARLASAPFSRSTASWLLFERGVRELQNHAVGLHLGAGPQDDLLDAPLRGRRNPSDVFRRERAESAHLANHRPALHGVGPDDRALNGRRGRFQPRQADADEDNGEQTHTGVNRLFDPLSSGIGRASNIHKSPGATLFEAKRDHGVDVGRSPALGRRRCRPMIARPRSRTWSLADTP